MRNLKVLLSSVALAVLLCGPRFVAKPDIPAGKQRRSRKPPAAKSTPQPEAALVKWAKRIAISIRLAARPAFFLWGAEPHSPVSVSSLMSSGR